MVKTEDLDKEVLYDKDNIQLVRRKDEATGKLTYSIITPETYVVLEESLILSFIEIILKEDIEDLL